MLLVTDRLGRFPAGAAMSAGIVREHALQVVAVHLVAPARIDTAKRVSLLPAVGAVNGVYSHLIPVQWVIQLWRGAGITPVSS